MDVAQLMFRDGLLDGERILVTGGGTGLGREMAEAFFIDTEIVGCPIIREPDGLAMSSRNQNLSQADRKKSPCFGRILRSARNDDEAVQQLEAAGFDIDYVETRQGRRFGAVLMGTEALPVRLIDNVSLG